MRIRWKLLILLLAIAIVPLVFVSTLDHRAMRHLGGEIASRARDALIDRAGQQLRQLVDDQAAVLWQQSQRLSQALRLQAHQVEKCLAAEPYAGAHVYYSQDYDRGTNLPPDMGPSARHYEPGADRRLRPIPITLSGQVFVFAPGVSPETVAADAARLSSMVPTYRLLYEGSPELIYWQYTSLENGLHSCYPGHGGYPPEYDPRARHWYTFAKSENALRWCAPYVDVSTHQMTITIATPVRRPDGAFAGVTAIDILASDLVGRLPLPSAISERAQTMLVAVQSPPGETTPAILIVARPNYQSERRRWNAPPELEWLTSADPAELRRLTEDMLAGRSGVLRMPFESQMCLWAYGPFTGGKAGVVMIVPYADVVTKAAEAEAYVLGRTWRQVHITGAVSGAVILLVAMIAFIYSRRVTRPIRQLARAARHVANGDLGTRVNIRTHDELGELGQAFNAMVPQLEDRLKIRHSLSLAMEVQQHLLPSRPPRVEGLDVAGKSIYCDETGGDYYDFLDLSRLGTNLLGVAVGDVTGHGIAAALLMATARALLRSRASQPGNLSAIMNDINSHLAEDTPTDRFMTLFYMIIDSRARHARWVCGGHDPAITYDPASDSLGEWEGGEIPLGIRPDWQYKEHGPVALSPGQVIVIGTDGIWEAHNPQGQMFGKDALREIIRQNAHRPSEEISRAITDALAAFRQSSPQEDDITLVVVKIVS